MVLKIFPTMFAMVMSVVVVAAPDEIERDHNERSPDKKTLFHFLFSSFFVCRTIRQVSSVNQLKRLKEKINPCFSEERLFFY
jgi:hypothetical protein